MEPKLCWELKECGRYPGGDNVDRFGVCPAYTQNAGDACWLVAGTFCDGRVQGTFAEKSNNCMACEVYQQYDLRHRTAVRKRHNA